jgi:hypothetical protein
LDYLLLIKQLNEIGWTLFQRAHANIPEHMGFESAMIPRLTSKGVARTAMVTAISRGADAAAGQGRLKTKSALPRVRAVELRREASSHAPQPVGAATYCFPATEWLIGLLWMPLPVWKLQSNWPFRASSARNSPDAA